MVYGTKVLFPGPTPVAKNPCSGQLGRAAGDECFEPNGKATHRAGQRHAPYAAAWRADVTTPGRSSWWPMRVTAGSSRWMTSAERDGHPSTIHERTRLSSHRSASRSTRRVGIYASNPADDNISRMDDITGKDFTTFGRSGSGVGEFGGVSGSAEMFGGPLGLAVDSQDRLYVADSDNGRDRARERRRRLGLDQPGNTRDRSEPLPRAPGYRPRFTGADLRGRPAKRANRPRGRHERGPVGRPTGQSRRVWGQAPSTCSGGSRSAPMAGST